MAAGAQAAKLICRFRIACPPSAEPRACRFQRTTHPGRYTDGRAPPEGSAFDIKFGERTNFDQYCSAIRSARRTIYIENQYIEVAKIVAELHGAVKRGVEVVLLVPAIPEISPTAYEAPERRAFFEARAALAKHDNFTLAGIAGVGSGGLRKPVYVHSKLMLIDDAWATVGSCNLHRFSLFGNGELNAAFLDPQIVRAFRVALFQEHLTQDTSALDGRTALQLFGQIARENRLRHENGDAVWRGLAISLDPATYGKAVQF